MKEGDIVTISGRYNPFKPEELQEFKIGKIEEENGLIAYPLIPIYDESSSKHPQTPH